MVSELDWFCCMVDDLLRHQASAQRHGCRAKFKLAIAKPSNAPPSHAVPPPNFPCKTGRCAWGLGALTSVPRNLCTRSPIQHPAN